MNRSNIDKSINEIFSLYKKRKMIDSFTLESIQDILEIGNEVFMKNNPDEADRLANRPKNNAPDLLDDEPFAFERTMEIYNQLSDSYKEISPELIRKVFQVNSKLAWEAYRKKYDEYIINIYKDFSDDEYINYLAAIVFYEKKDFDSALSCINKSVVHNSTSANYTHIKGMCLMQLGEFETARTFLYQALFLVELKQDTPPKHEKNKKYYPNYPVEFQTSAAHIRSDLNKIDRVDSLYNYQLLPLFTS
ncbi:MAG: hypothetical protein GF313_00765 [Caldithrix sp.]|nr:hypothetical protein [Caldithrix sp.]